MGDYTTRLAEALNDHVRDSGCCACGWKHSDSSGVGFGYYEPCRTQHKAHVVQMLAAVVRDAQADALRDAATHLSDNLIPGIECADSGIEDAVQDWLNDRADSIAPGVRDGVEG
jgi:hypothetical protein